MVLVDTSVWVDHFRGVDSPESARLKQLIDDEEDLCICGTILTETLQGIRYGIQYRRTKRLLSHLVYLPTGRLAHISSADIYRRARKKGITIRKSIDCIIAAGAIAASVPLLHRDSDSERIARVSRLKTIAASA